MVKKGSDRSSQRSEEGRGAEREAGVGIVCRRFQAEVYKLPLASSGAKRSLERVVVQW